MQAEQNNIRDIVQIQALRKVMSWANLACTTYDICVAIREVLLNNADGSAIFHNIIRGMIIDQLVDCLLSGPVKIVAKAIMICKELGDQVDTIKYDLEQGDYISAGIHAVHLLVMIFSIMAQCFTGETEVMTDEGLIAIEDIEVGDYVLAEDTVSGDQEYKEVLNVFVSQTNKLVHVTTTDSESGTTINTTDNHPFYVEGKGWVPAIELEAGDELRTADGSIEVVEDVNIEYLEEAVLIYNLEIEGYHTYFVSDESVLVHNKYKSDDVDDIKNDNSSNKENVLEGVKNAEVEYKLNPQTGQMEPYMKQYKLNDDYKILLRKDFGDFNHNDPKGNHWNLEVQTTKGRTVYDLHMYVDDAGDLLPITSDNVYIPPRSPFNN